jgi:hypothetical protein
MQGGFAASARPGVILAELFDGKIGAGIGRQLGLGVQLIKPGYLETGQRQIGVVKGYKNQKRQNGQKDQQN